MTILRTVPSLPGLVPAILASLAAWAVSLAFPLLGPLLLALLIGAIVANTGLMSTATLDAQAPTTKLMLRLGVVLLGLKLPLDDIIGVGLAGLIIIFATVLTTYFSTILIGTYLKLDKGFVTLLAAGFSICGAAAIAAVDDAVQSRRKDVALAVAMVTLFGSAMIAFIPWASSALGLTTEQSAIWAGASIHEVAQVVAAASIIGTGALAVATTIKLGRVMLLAPMYAIAAHGASSSTGKKLPLVPWFVMGFAGAVAIRTTGVLPGGALDVAANATTILLAAGMFGLGLGFRILDLWPVPWRAVALATCSTCVAAGVSLLGVTTLT